jgi:hypothetical protein
MPATPTYETDPANPDPELDPDNPSTDPAAPSDPDSATGENDAD